MLSMRLSRVSDWVRLDPLAIRRCASLGATLLFAAAAGQVALAARRGLAGQRQWWVPEDAIGLCGNVVFDPLVMLLDALPWIGLAVIVSVAMASGPITRRWLTPVVAAGVGLTLFLLADITRRWVGDLLPDLGVWWL